MQASACSADHVKASPTTSPDKKAAAPTAIGGGLHPKYRDGDLTEAKKQSRGLQRDGRATLRTETGTLLANFFDQETIATKASRRWFRVWRRSKLKKFRGGFGISSSIR
jgi:hypothetical protein